MKNSFCRGFVIKIIFFFIAYNVYSQNQEDKIYATIDAFIADPKSENLKTLNQAEADFLANKSIKTNDDWLPIVILNCNKAFYENQFGAIQKAISSYEKAWQIFDKNKLENYDIVEFCLKPLGNLYTKIGDYDNAENIIKQYYFIAENSNNTTQKIAAVVNLSNVVQNTGRVNLAIDLLESTLKIRNLNAFQKGILWSNLGANYLLENQLSKAKSSVEKAIKFLEKQKNQEQNLSNCYKNLANIYFQNNDFKMADASFEIAINYAKKIVCAGRHVAAKNYYDYALLCYKMKNYSSSNRYTLLALSNLVDDFNAIKEEVPQQQFLFADLVLLVALDLKADLYLIQNQPKKALSTYKLCGYIEDLFDNLLVYENSKIINQVRVRNRVEKCIGIYEYLFKIEKNESYLEKAFELSDNTKSRVLTNYLSRIATASNSEKALINKLQNIHNEIIKEQQKLNYADLGKINTLIKNQNQTMLLLKKSQSENQKNGANQKINLQQLFAKLNSDNASLMEYFSGQNTIFTFAVSDNKISLKSFAQSEINKNKITGFIDFFTTSDAITNDVSGYNLAGKSVFDLLQITKKLHKNLIIIPDGLLNFVPFEALITKSSTSSNFAKMHYLMNDCAIGYNNSAGFYLNSKSLSGQNSVLGIFPVFEKTNYELAASKNEMLAIKKLFDGRFLENSKATFGNFKANAGQFSILHLSTHADGGTIETPATIKFFDRDVLYSELYDLEINPDLVVLSACQTGIGKLYKSEGAMSVARGFQASGAQNLLFSLWKVNDYTTSVFMANFYKNIKKKMSFLAANQKAKLDFLKNKTIPNAKKSPYYWSAFVYYGTLEQPATNYWIWVLGCSVLVLCVWFLKKKFRK